jgi:AraC-like DNA-binding protein
MADYSTAITQTDLLQLMDLAISSINAEPPILGGTGICPLRPGEQARPEVIYPAARLTVQLESCVRYVVSNRGQRMEVELAPGQCLFLPPYAWAIQHLEMPGKFFGVVFRPECVRLIDVVRSGGLPLAPPPLGYHTALPLEEAGTHVLAALTSLAEKGKNAPPARDLIIALLELVRRQVAEDIPFDSAHPRAARTWQAVQSHLGEHFGREVTRDSVAQSLNLHPNYLSALAREVEGKSFRQTLLDIRLTHARRLLRDTDQKLFRIAALCGFSAVTPFATAFRRVVGMTPGRYRLSARENLAPETRPE